MIEAITPARISHSHAQKALTRSERHYRDLMLRAPSIVCQIGPDGTIEMINDAVRTILGWDPEALAGTNLRSVVASDTTHRFEKFRETMRRREVSSYELPMRSRDGFIRWIAWNSVNLRDADGALRSFVLFGIDVTDRREAKESACKLAELELAKTRAEAANRAKMEFLAVMSHELRTPLNAIGGYAQLLETGARGPVSGAQVEDLRRIRRSQAHLLGLINDMMNLARLETGRVVFRNAEHRVRDLLENIQALTGPQIRMNDLEYHVVPCPDSLIVWGDRDKIQQILLNLASNAIKFTAPGGRIEIECEHAGPMVHFRITDTGKGIPADKLEAIFDPFVQVNANDARPQDGVGLGLAISRDLALGMGGDLTAKSTEGVGSTFTLRLKTHRSS